MDATVQQLLLRPAVVPSAALASPILKSLLAYQQQLGLQILALNKSGVGAAVHGKPFTGKSSTLAAVANSWLDTALKAAPSSSSAVRRKPCVLIIAGRRSLLRWHSELTRANLGRIVSIWDANCAIGSLVCRNPRAIWRSRGTFIPADYPPETDFLLASAEQLGALIRSARSILHAGPSGELVQSELYCGVMLDLRCVNLLALEASLQRAVHEYYDDKAAVRSFKATKDFAVAAPGTGTEHWISLIAAQLGETIINRVVVTDGHFPASSQATAALLDFLIPAERSRQWAAWLHQCEQSLPLRSRPAMALAKLTIAAEADRNAELLVAAQAREEIIALEMEPLQQGKYAAALGQLTSSGALSGAPGGLDALAAALCLLRKICFHEGLLCVSPLKGGSAAGSASSGTGAEGGVASSEVIQSQKNQSHVCLTSGTLIAKLGDRLRPSQAEVSSLMSGSCKLKALPDVLEKYRSMRVFLAVQSADELLLVHRFLELKGVAHSLGGMGDGARDLNGTSVGGSLSWLSSQQCVHEFNSTNVDSCVVLTTCSAFEPPNSIPRLADVVIVLSENWVTPCDIHACYRTRLMAAGHTGDPVHVIRLVAKGTLEEAVARGKSGGLAVLQGQRAEVWAAGSDEAAAQVSTGAAFLSSAPPLTRELREAALAAKAREDAEREAAEKGGVGKGKGMLARVNSSGTAEFVKIQREKVPGFGPSPTLDKGEEKGLNWLAMLRAYMEVAEKDFGLQSAKRIILPSVTTPMAVTAALASHDGSSSSSESPNNLTKLMRDPGVKQLTRLTRLLQDHALTDKQGKSIIRSAGPQPGVQGQPRSFIFGEMDSHVDDLLLLPVGGGGIGLQDEFPFDPVTVAAMQAGQQIDDYVERALERLQCIEWSAERWCDTIIRQLISPAYSDPILTDRLPFIPEIGAKSGTNCAQKHHDNSADDPLALSVTQLARTSFNLQVRLAYRLAEEEQRLLCEQAIEETLGISRKRGLPTSDYIETKQRKRLRVAGVGLSHPERSFWLQMVPTMAQDLPLVIPHGCELELGLYSSFKNTIREMRRIGMPVDNFLFVNPLQSASKSDAVEIPSWQSQVNKSHTFLVDFPAQGPDLPPKKVRKDAPSTLVIQQKRKILEAAPAPQNALANKKGNRLEHDKIAHAPLPLAGSFLPYSYKPTRIIPLPVSKTKRTLFHFLTSMRPSWIIQTHSRPFLTSPTPLLLPPRLLYSFLPISALQKILKLLTSKPGAATKTTL